MAPMLIVVWRPWWDAVLAAVSIFTCLWAMRQGRLYKRQRRALGNTVYRLPVPAPGQPKVTVQVEGEAPQAAYWEKTGLRRDGLGD